jgi:hypothetical protein
LVSRARLTKNPVRRFALVVSANFGAVVRHSHENTRGGATNPLGANQPGKVLKDAAVFGLRSVLKF